MKKFPLKTYTHEIPSDQHPGAFGVKRKFDIHTGIDLYCEVNDEVICIEDGTILEIVKFTGPLAKSPWWNDTDAILVKGHSGIILYGEIKVNSSLRKGRLVRSGDVLGTVQTVLKKDKSKPMTMLHLELYNQEVKDGVVWNLNEQQPKELENPYDLLKKIKK